LIQAYSATVEVLEEAWLAPHFWEDWKLEINVEHHFPFPLTSWHFWIFLGLEPQNELEP
jgi:hypothetical protein